jgi:hypothetical protein
MDVSQDLEKPRVTSARLDCMMDGLKGWLHNFHPASTCKIVITYAGVPSQYSMQKLAVPGC